MNDAVRRSANDPGGREPGIPMGIQLQRWLGETARCKRKEAEGEKKSHKEKSKTTDTALHARKLIRYYDTR